MSGRRTAALLLVLVVAGGVRVANLLWMARQPFSRFQFSWADSDMATHWEWAGRIVHGDLLTREAYHPYPSWMQEIAPLESWSRWHGLHTFNKAPLYPYVLAAMRGLVGEDYLAIGFCHLAIGVLNTALIFLLASCYFDLATATVAGLGAALYGPSLLYETLLLRDPLAVTVSLLLLLALSRCTTAARRPWMLAGAAFALALLGRELVAPFAVFVALWMWQRFGGDRGQMARALGAFALGTALGLVPLVARNVAVGAPPLALSAVGVEGIIYGHAVDTVPASFRPSAYTSVIMRASDGRVLDTIRGTLATYRGDWTRLARNEALRAAAIFSTLEGSDNVNWYYFLDRSPILPYTLRWEVVLGAGLVGIWLSRRRVQGDDRLVLYFLGLSVVALQFVPVIGRYRLVPASLLMIYAAVTVVTIARAVRARAWITAGVPMLAVTCLVVVSARLLLVPSEEHWCRSSDYVNDVLREVNEGDSDGVYAALRDAVVCLTKHTRRDVLAPGFDVFPGDFLAAADALDRSAEAAQLLDRLSAAYPRDAGLRELAASAHASAAANGS